MDSKAKWKVQAGTGWYTDNEVKGVALEVMCPIFYYPQKLRGFTILLFQFLKFEIYISITRETYDHH